MALVSPFPSAGNDWKSTVGRFATGRFWQFTRKTSSVGKEKVNKWEVCKYKITTIVVFDIIIQRIFLSLRVSANALYDCRFIYFHSLIKSTFLLRIGLLCLYDKQYNTWLLVDMEFIFSCSRSIELNTWRELPYRGAPMYYSIFVARYFDFITR